MDAGLWAQLSPERVAVVEQLQDLLRRLEAARADTFQVAEGSGAVVGEGSRLYAEGLTKIYRRRKVVNEVDIAVEQGRPPRST